jgi:hypothetical protein
VAIPESPKHDQGKAGSGEGISHARGQPASKWLRSGRIEAREIGYGLACDRSPQLAAPGLELG